VVCRDGGLRFANPPYEEALVWRRM
jgi:hypothetical protein